MRLPEPIVTLVTTGTETLGMGLRTVLNVTDAPSGRVGVAITKRKRG